MHIKVIIFPKVGIDFILATPFPSTDLMTTNSLVFNNNTKYFCGSFFHIFLPYLNSCSGCNWLWKTVVTMFLFPYQRQRSTGAEEVGCPRPETDYIAIPVLVLLINKPVQKIEEWEGLNVCNLRNNAIFISLKMFVHKLPWGLKGA